MRKKWLIVAGATLSVALLAFVRTQDSATQDTATQSTTEQAASSVQPIAFPHNVHAGTYQIQCLYCHFSATSSVDAGIPPVGTCMGCPWWSPAQAESGRDQKVAGYFQRGERSVDAHPQDARPSTSPHETRERRRRLPDLLRQVPGRWACSGACAR
jgi:hypothetical protein